MKRAMPLKIVQPAQQKKEKILVALSVRRRVKNGVDVIENLFLCLFLVQCFRQQKKFAKTF
nr:hypothetical protein GZ27B6_4 [uncultured archaeon GZfos27B6]